MIGGWFGGSASPNPNQIVVASPESDSEVDQPRPTNVADHHGEHSHGYLLCLECRCRSVLDEDGLESLEFNSFLAEAADRLAQKMSICADCERSMTAKYCEECIMYLCNPCCKRIHSGTMTSKHRIIDLDVMSPEETSTGISYCAFHPKSEAALYCSTCHELACVLCAYGAHKQHDICLLAESAHELKQSLGTTANLVTMHHELISEACQRLNDEIGHLNENAVSAKSYLKAKFKEVQEAISEFETLVINDIDQDRHNRGRMLKQQLENLRAVNADLKLRVKLSKTILQNPNSAEAVQLANRQIDVLKTAIDEIPSLEQCTSANVDVAFGTFADRLRDMAGEIIEARRSFKSPLDGCIIETKAKAVLADEQKVVLEREDTPTMPEDGMVSSKDEEDDDVQSVHSNHSNTESTRPKRSRKPAKRDLVVPPTKRTSRPSKRRHAILTADPEEDDDVSTQGADDSDCETDEDEEISKPARSSKRMKSHGDHPATAFPASTVTVREEKENNKPANLRGRRAAKDDHDVDHMNKKETKMTAPVTASQPMHTMVYDIESDEDDLPSPPVWATKKAASSVTLSISKPIEEASGQRLVGEDGRFVDFSALKRAPQ
jgi:hypothetical protein